MLIGASERLSERVYVTHHVEKTLMLNMIIAAITIG